MVSHPETGSDSPIGSDRDRGRDIIYPKQVRKLLGYISGCYKSPIMTENMGRNTKTG